MEEFERLDNYDREEEDDEDGATRSPHHAGHVIGY
jgi:hypothetical protein